MMMTASATAPSPSSPPNMTSGRNHSRRHQRSASGSSFSFSNERGLGAFTPLSGLPRRSRSVHHPADADSTPREMPTSASPPSARSLSASTTPRVSVGLTTPVSPSRVKKASFSFGGSSDDEEDDDCPLVREVNQRARLAKSPTEVDHFGDFSFDAEAHKAKSARLTTTQEADTETETETEADFPPTPVGDAAPAPRLTISTNIPPAVVPFPALSPSPERSTLPLPPLSIPDASVGSPVVRSASSPFLSSPPPKPDAKQGPGLRIGIPSSASSTSPYNSGTSTPIMLKNGRQLKPSLKSRVNLSLSTPDVSSMLSHSKSAPGTPRVHFPTRERLESVVLFDKRARPLEVAAGDSPLASPRGFFDDTPGFRIRPQSSFPFPSVSPRGSPMGSTANLQGLSAAIMAKTKLKIAISRSAPLQPIPRPEANVHLAAMRLLSTRLTGSVLVKNVSFSKKVMIRYTFDHWETTMEVSGMWSSPDALNDLPSGSVKAPGNEETERDIARAILVPAPNGYDRFVFNIKLDDVAPYLSKRPMLLAVKFEAAGVGEWWDNCGGLNYRFEFDHVPKPEAPKVDSAPVTPPVTFGRPRSNTSPAPLNMDATHTQTDLPSATLLSAKLNSVVEKQTPEPVELPVARPNLKLTFPSDETITAVPADLTADLGAELAAPKATAIGVPTAKKPVTTLTPPDSTSSSPREVPIALPPPSAPAASLPSPAESPASRRQSSPLPSPSAIDAPAHSTTNVKDQSYADFIAKYCFAGASAAAPTAPAATPAPNFGSSFGAPPQSNAGNPSWGSPAPNFGWGSTAPSHQPWGGVGFQYGRSTQSYTGGDL